MLEINHILYLDFADLQAYGLPSDNIKTGCKRFNYGESTSWANIPHPSDGRKVLVQYSTIPNTTKGKYGIPTEQVLRSKLHTEHEQNLMQLLRNILPMTPAKDIATLQSFRIVRDVADVCSGEVQRKTLSALPEPVIRQYAHECRWLNLLTMPRWRQKAQRMELDASFATVDEFTRIALLTAAADGLKLPSNARVFKNRLKEYRELGAVAVISAKWGNTNAQIVDEVAGARLVSLMADRRKPSFEMVQEWYNSYALENSLPRLGLSTVKSYLSRPDIKPLWTYAQHGVDYFKNHYEYQMSTSKASERDVLWIFDGTKVNKRYRTASGVAAKLNMMVVMDAHSEMLLGWKMVAAKETQKEIGEAIRMAIQTAGGRLPMQFLYDNDASNKAFMADYIEKFNGLAFPAKPYNGRSKPIENLFFRLQNRVLRADENFTGQNITATSMRSRQNMDGFSPKDLPTLDECIKQAEIELHVWNNLPGPDGKTPKERYAESQVSKETRMLTPEMECTLFWEWNERPIQYDSYGLVMKHQGQKRVYEVMDGNMPDFEFQAQNTGRSFQIKYDAQDLTGRVALFDGERFVAFAEAKQAVPRAIADYNEDSREQINTRLQGQAWQQASIRARLAATQEFVTEADADLEDTLKMGHRFIPKQALQQAETDYYERQEGRTVAIKREPINSDELQQLEPVANEKYLINKARLAKLNGE